MLAELEDSGQWAGTPFVMRFLGRAAASGMRQVVFTFFSANAADAAFRIAWAWWVFVPHSIDRRFYRLMKVRWFAPQ